MKLTRLLVVSAFVLVVAHTQSAHALSTCGVAEPWTFSNLDTFYINADGCPTQNFINDAWDRFSFTNENWFAYGMEEDSCNINTPLARTWQALRLLAYAGDDHPHCDFSNQKTINWAYCYSGSMIDELLVQCEISADTPNAIASTAHSALQDQYTALHRGFFYGQSVPWRAASIFHEARHAEDDCKHVDNCPFGRKGCDHAFDNGCWGGDGQGAYTFTFVWLEWFYVDPQPRMVDQSILKMVLTQANAVLATHFEVDPCFRLMADGTRMIGVDEMGNPIPGC